MQDALYAVYSNFSIFSSLYNDGHSIIPATIYPKTTGCFNHLKTNVIIPAAINITARSEIRGAISDMLFIIMCLQIYILT